MSLLDQKPNMKNFSEVIQGLSRSSKAGISIAIAKFNDFTKRNCEGKTIDETIQFIKALPNNEQEPKLFQILQAWVNDMAGKKLTNGSCKMYFSGINKYFRYHGFKITQDDLKTYQITFPQKMEEERYPITIQDILEIFKVAKHDKIGFYLFLLSSAMRPFEALSIRIKHIKLRDDGFYQISIPAKATKLKRQRTTFISKEAGNYLSTRLRKMKDMSDETLVWTKNENTKNAVSNEDEVFKSYCEKVGFTEKYETTGFNKLNLYCFRTFFITKVSRHDENIAKLLAGQKGYQLQYDRLTNEEKLVHYKEFEPELLIFDTSKKDAKIKQLTQANNEIENLKEAVS